MKTLHILLLLLATCTMAAGQNVVLNGNFETKETGTGCPNQTGFSNGKPANWSIPVNGFTPDYFFPCASPGSNFFPGKNVMGCEFPLQGQSYVGLLAHQVSGDGTVTAAGSEYISQQVTLTGGQQYYVEFWVSRAEGTTTNPFNSDVKTLGMFFTPNPNNLSNGAINGLHHLVPQVPNNFPASTFYSVTNGWTKISGTFTPTSSGAWTIVIGNFDSRLNQTATAINDPNINPATGYRFSYYFIDGVTIIPSNQAAPDYTRTLLGPSIVCNTGSYSISDIPAGVTVGWSSSNPAGVSVSSTGVVTRLTGYNGSVTITATISNPTCFITVARTIWIGLPDPYNNAKVSVMGQYGINPVELYADYTYNFTMDPVAGATGYNWDPLPSGFSWPNGWSGSPSSLVVIRTASEPGYYVLAAQPQNSCGAAGARYLGINIPDGGGIMMRMASPNPSSDVLNVKLSEAADIEAEITLTNQKGTAYKKSIRAKEHTIVTSNLPEGMYVLRIQTHQGSSQQQIIIRH